MKFSVVTVCFNAESHISRAIDSLSEQTFEDFEWIVVDGGSTDRTLSLVNAVTGFGKSVISQRDDGIYDAMNKGISMAQGEYVFFLNADDAFASRNVLREVANQLDSLPEVQIFVGRIWHVFSDRRILRDFSHLTYNRLLIDSVCHQASFVRRELLVSSGGFDLRYRMCADYDWFLRVLGQGVKMVFSQTVVALFSADGAHVKRREITEKETRQIRRGHLNDFQYRLYTFWRYMDHYWRRLRNLRPRGHVLVEGG